ncbi:hypothetical protein [Alkalihalobacterium alkalinitrilicum]|uniref:hypothetical protein n=1 Tax=Alkalihalobacterium alkalinitrilicum TaxID=427920 RepID=UPI0009959C2D|nr:hypothetical protein [Alkalihalobacterium alkalinitrilicum]
MESKIPHKSNVQKTGAIFGLIASATLILILIVQLIWVKGLTDLSPASLVQWAIDHQFLLFFSPLMILAVLFYGVLLQGIKDRLKESTPQLASLSVRFGWMTILLIIFGVVAEWFHIYQNAVVWDQEVSHQFSRLTFDMIFVLNMASLSFFAGWLITTGLGSLRSNGFSKAFSWVTLVVAAAVALNFFLTMWEPFISIPFSHVLWYFSSIYFVVWLIWASLELLLRKVP